MRYAERIAQESLSTRVAGATPMDVDALMRKGDRKGKGKSKQSQKGRATDHELSGKGKQDTKWCRHCNAYVKHDEASCWWKPKQQQPTKGSKAAGKGAGKGAGKQRANGKG